MVECERSGVMEETALRTVKAETEEEESASPVVVVRYADDHDREDSRTEAGDQEDTRSDENDSDASDARGKKRSRETSTESGSDPRSTMGRTSSKKRGRSAIKSVDERFTDLMDFKQKFGHFNVKRTGEYKSLGIWCSALRVAYKKIQNGETNTKYKLTPEHKRKLEDAGFKWCLVLSAYKTFDERYAELMKYKEKCGHCNVSQLSVEYKSLGMWCNNLKRAYRKIQNRQAPHTKLTEENIRKLDDAGFKWTADWHSRAKGKIKIVGGDSGTDGDSWCDGEYEYFAC